MNSVIFILLGAIVGVGAVLRLLHKPDSPDATDTTDTTGNADDATSSSVSEGECCGQHAVCERDSLITGIDDSPVYFDDEELDSFIGRGADDYTDDEIEQFRDVMMTLLPDDVAPWARSIAQRGITLPQPVKEELLMLVDDIRRQRTTINQQA